MKKNKASPLSEFLKFSDYKQGFNFIWPYYNYIFFAITKNISKTFLKTCSNNNDILSIKWVDI